jgi:hypothetical protein
MTSKTYGIFTGVAVVALGACFAPSAKADCEYSATPQWTTAASPARSSLDHRPMERDEGGDPSRESIVGLWHVTVTESGRVIIQSIEAFHSDGTETLNDTGAPSGGNVCLGVWIQSGPRTYKLKHPFWRWDIAGNLIGSAVIRAELTLGKHGDVFSGNATVDILDLSGNVLVQVKQQVAGERITVDF